MMKNSTKLFLGILAGLIVFGGLISFLFYFALFSVPDEDSDVIVGSGKKIALIELKGVIFSSEELVKQFKKYREDRSIKGILFRVDSPGGGVVASQEVYQEVKKTREYGKPIVVSMGSMAASGGYYVSCPANKIVANPGTLTGSIGVISQFTRLDPLLDKIGVDVNVIKSGKFKDAGSPFREMTPADRSYFQNLMDEVHRQFITAVETERKLSRDSVIAFSDGRVFTGEQAVKIGLADTLGTFQDAVMLTALLAGIDGEPSIVKQRKRGLSILDRLLGMAELRKYLGLDKELLDQPILQYKMLPSF
ncbi:MAG TPA: signal peptide peptidase SppA [Bacteroidota bacterium]|nr:signal peptide peptidase SppA [Bacteroidota bacterium]